MNFGERVRQLREGCGITQKELAQRLNVSSSYVNKVERGRLRFGDFPSVKFIHSLAGELDADEDELLLLAERVPETIRKRIQERPDAFREIAGADDETLDRVLRIVRSTK